MNRLLVQETPLLWVSSNTANFAWILPQNANEIHYMNIWIDWWDVKLMLSENIEKKNFNWEQYFDSPICTQNFIQDNFKEQRCWCWQNQRSTQLWNVAFRVLLKILQTLCISVQVFVKEKLRARSMVSCAPKASQFTWKTMLKNITSGQF